MHRALISFPRHSAATLCKPSTRTYLTLWSRRSIQTLSVNYTLHHRPQSNQTTKFNANRSSIRTLTSTTSAPGAATYTYTRTSSADTPTNSDSETELLLLPAPSQSSETLLLNPTRISELHWSTPKFFPSSLMLVIGLTGGIATGKSSVSTLLKSYKIPVIDADIIAREVVAPGTPALRQIVRTFGPEVLLSDGSLDRKKLGGIVFNDEAKRKQLNGIVHPAVRKAMFWSVVRCWVRGERICVLDVPLLIEGGLWKLVGKVVVVYCSAEIQLQRLMKRDSSTHTEASSRLNSQIPIAHKLQYADIIVDNSGSHQDLQIQVDSLIRRLQKEAGWSWRVSWLFPPWGVFSAASTLAWRAIKRVREGRRERDRLAGATARVVAERS